MYESEIRIDLSAAGITVLELLGDHDLATADELSAAIDQALASRPGLVVDLTETTFMDSTVVHLLINAHQVLEARGHELIVQITEASPVLRVLELTQLDNALGIARDRDEAIASANGWAGFVSHLAAPPSSATPHDREFAVEDSADPAPGSSLRRSGCRQPLFMTDRRSLQALATRGHAPNTQHPSEPI